MDMDERHQELLARFRVGCEAAGISIEEAMTEALEGYLECAIPARIAAGKSRNEICVDARAAG